MLCGILRCVSEEESDGQCSTSIQEIHSISDRTQKIASSSTGMWRAESRLLSTAFAAVSGCVEAWERSGCLYTERTSEVMEELVRAMRTGLRIISTNRKGWKVRTLFVGGEIMYVLQQLRDLVHLLSILLLGEDLHHCAKSLVRLTAIVFVADIDDLRSDFDNAAALDRYVVVEKLKNWQSGHEELKRIMLSEGDRESLMISHKHLELKKRIGFGTFGSVYEAAWLHQAVAVKIFRPGDLSFEKEVSALVELQQHPNVVSIIGLSRDSKLKECCSIVMERMTMDLEMFIEEQKKLNGGKVPLITAVSIMLQIAQGMAFLHAKNVIHRDVKPRNILVKYFEGGMLVAKISDLGTARTNFCTSQVASATMGVGTKVYRAPEVFRSENTDGKPTYSKKTDVYSFAIVCCYLVSGRLPFEDIADRIDFAIQVCAENKRPELPADCLPELATLIKKCWSRNAEERPSFAETCQTLKQIRALVLGGTSRWYEPLDNNLGASSLIREFTLKEVAEALTRNKGMWMDGMAYRGKLETGEDVAVEVLPSGVLEIELQVSCRIHHPNIVKLLGYYNQGGRFSTVSEYIRGGCLFEHLHLGGRHGIVELEWTTRIDTAIGAARGLSHLHALQIIHGNVHPITVFLSGESQGKIKFPLSREAQQYKGYTDPAGVLSFASDVYNFGIVMLRLVTLQSSDVRQILENTLTTRGIKYFLDNHVDPELVPEHKTKLTWYLEVAVKCLEPEAEKRPLMDDIISLLLNIRNWGLS